MKKTNTIIIILTIIILILSGYIIYNKTNNQKLNKEETNNTTIIKPLNSQVLSVFSGKYSYEKIYSEDICLETNEKSKEKIKFELKEDGTFTYSYNLDCGGGFEINGNYYLGDDKIYLISNDCLFEVSNENSISHGNCHPVEEIYYSINNSNTQLYLLKENNDKINFNKNQ